MPLLYGDTPAVEGFQRMVGGVVWWWGVAYKSVGMRLFGFPVDVRGWWLRFALVCVCVRVARLLGCCPVFSFVSFLRSTSLDEDLNSFQLIRNPREVFFSCWC